MSQMKFISNPERCIEDMLNGMKIMYPSLMVDAKFRTTYSKEINDNVNILSGGGSGHEPFTAGFVGSGMLDAAVAGSVFTSPPSQNIFRAISNLNLSNQGNGVLVIIMNYTGDVLNFGLAIEQAKLLNMKVETVIVDEDCSKFDDKTSVTGRRGMCGGVIVMKIAGGMSRTGKQLKEIRDACRTVVSNLGSIGTCVTSCTVPSVGPLFDLPQNQMEIGIGVHGEAGVLRTELLPIKHLVTQMVDKILAYLSIENKVNCKVCVMINNLGAVSQLEMGVIANNVHSVLSEKGIEICRIYAGPLMTSLDMAGFQICLLDITDHPEWLDYLDSETNAPAWPKTVRIPSENSRTLANASDGNWNVAKEEGPIMKEEERIIFEKCLKACAEVLIKNRDRLNNLDKCVGDGDTGNTLKNLADCVLADINKLPLDRPSSCFLCLAKTGQEKMGGTSGALYGLMFTSAAHYLMQFTEEQNRWLNVYEAILQAMNKYSTAKRGDRTMMDVIIPVYEEYKKQYRAKKNHKSAFIAAASIARKKAEETTTMKPRVGRATYVSQQHVKSEDPGAYAVALLFETIASQL